MTKISHDGKPTLVLGGTGKTGRRIVERLGARGVPVRVGSRSGQPPFDWGDQEVALPAVDGQFDPFIDADDIADVAVAALTEPGHAGQVYELTSPRLLSFPEAIAEIAKASGREITYVPVSVDEYAAGAAEHGVPAQFVEFLTHLFSDVLGNSANVTDGVQQGLGRPPRDFTDYAIRIAATGIWTQAADR